MLKPVAKMYNVVMPDAVQVMISNGYDNVQFVPRMMNSLFQGKFEGAARELARFMLNSTLGIGGLFDVATEAGLERQEEDFGQTLGKWGFGAGPYLVIPILGPSSVRDAVALPLDRSATPTLAFGGDTERYGLATLNFVDARARYLSAGRLLDEIALDRYSFLRDAYLTRRRSLVYDGEPPEEPEAEDHDTGEPVSTPAR
jgi:phospholipid-binding lipoprotein MlaA